MKRLLASRVLVVLGTFLMASGITAAQQEDAILTSVPPEAMAFISADIEQIRAFWEEIKGTTLGRLLAQEFARARPGAAAGANPSQILEMLSHAFQDRVSLALMDEKWAPKQVPPMVVVIPLKNYEHARALLTVAQMQLQLQGRATFTAREYQGVQLTSVSAGRLKEGQLGYALLDDRLLIATKPSWLEKAVDLSIQLAEGLGNNAEFQRVQALVAAKGPAPAWFWWDPTRLNQRMMEMAEEAARSKGEAKGQPAAKPRSLPIQPAMLKQVMEAYTAAGGRLELSHEGIAFDTVTLINAENAIGRKLMAQKGAPLRSARLASADPLLYIGFNNLPFVIEITQMLFSSMQGDVQQMLAGIGQALQTATGLNPKVDLLDHIGTECAIVLNDLPPDLKTIPALFYLHTTSVPALDKTMQKLRAHLGEGLRIKFIEKNVPEGRYYYMDQETAPLPVSPGWTFAGDFLVIGVAPDALKSPLVLAKGNGHSLADSPVYQRTVATAGENLTGAFFVDLAKATALLEKLPAKPGKGQKAAPPAAVKQALKALGTLSGVSSVQGDVFVMRTDLSLDLTK